MSGRNILLLCVLLLAPQVVSADISGVWKHAEQPAWIAVKLDEGNATVVRNDDHPDRVGRTILTQLEADNSDPNLWRGLIYIEKLGEYVDVEVTLTQPDRMETTGKVGFMSRTVDWVRADEIQR